MATCTSCSSDKRILLNRKMQDIMGIRDKKNQWDVIKIHSFPKLTG